MSTRKCPYDGGPIKTLPSWIGWVLGCDYCTECKTVFWGLSPGISESEPSVTDFQKIILKNEKNLKKILQILEISESVTKDAQEK